MPPDHPGTDRTRDHPRDGGLSVVGRDASAAPTPAELLGRVALGDEDAFSRLYDETSSLLFTLVRRVVRDVAMSEEVLQEVFVEIWKQATRFDPRRGSAHGWMCTIAHRRAVDTVRASDASRRRDSDEGLRSIAEKVVDVQEEGIMRVESHRVATAMRSLTPVQADAIRLAYFGGYSHREVASLLGIPVGTAKTRIRDGMIVLRDRLGVTA
ncbi:ECF RNA polymerase sigma factor SigK [Brachybacterium sp. UNK5269]|uniref:ECF RNA polymerase sigma factor SigK n=1 Tax=Brachybacterium sp. UNK5269 TaxID=3408576 RepID=UPI003BAF97D2